MKLQKPKGTQECCSTRVCQVAICPKNLPVRHLGNLIMLRFVLLFFEHYELSAILLEIRQTRSVTKGNVRLLHTHDDDKGGPPHHPTRASSGRDSSCLVRSYVENRLFAPEVQRPVKLYYGLCFRYSPPGWSSAGVSWVEQSALVLTILRQT